MGKSAPDSGYLRIRAVGYFSPIWSSSGQRLFYMRIDDKGRRIESSDIRGEKVTTIFSLKEYFWGGGLCLTPDGRILFPMSEPGPRLPVYNLWEIKVDAVTGKSMSEPDVSPVVRL